MLCLTHNRHVTLQPSSQWAELCSCQKNLFGEVRTFKCIPSVEDETADLDTTLGMSNKLISMQYITVEPDVHGQKLQIY